MDVLGSGAARRLVAVATLRAGLMPATALAAMATAGCAESAAAGGRAGRRDLHAVPAAVDRCALLAPATVAALEHDESAPCADALGQLDLPGGQVVSSAVWGDNAQVRLTGDTLFLTRTAAGWKVAAAGCTPQGEAPYLCRLEA